MIRFQRIPFRKPSLWLLAAVPVWSANAKVNAAAPRAPVDQPGTVYDTNGQPAADAAVWAYPFDHNAGNGHPMIKTTADAVGRFTLALPEGDWRVVARKETRFGVANNAYGMVGIESANPPEPCIIRLAPRGTLRGRLLDRQTGQPIPRGGLWIDEVGLIQTNAEGRYEAPGLTPETHHAVVLCPGYLRNYLLFDTTLRPDAELDLRLIRATRITGTVVDRNDRPIPNACVGRPTSGHSTAIVAFYEPCDEAGRFEWDGLAMDAPLEIEAAAPGYAAKRRDIFVPQGADPPELRFVLEREPKPSDNSEFHVLEGTVYSPEGQPVVGARVRCYWNYRQDRRCETRTDVRGQFTLRRVPDIPGYLEVTARKHEPAYMALLRQGDLKGDITLDVGRTVRGRVHDSAGQPIEGAMVTPVAAARLQPECVEPWVWQLHTLTDKDGRFELKNLPEDGFRYDVFTLNGGHLTLPDIQDNMTITVTGSGAVRGRVLDPQGRPVRDFRISIEMSKCEETRPAFAAGVQIDPNLRVTGGFYAGLRVNSLGVLYTSDDGTFVLNDLHPHGVEIVVADAPGCRRVFQDCVHTCPVEKLPPADKLTLQMRPSAPLRVRVVQDASPDLPIASASVGLSASPIPGSSGDYTPPHFEWGSDDRPRLLRQTGPDGWASFDDMPFDGVTLIVKADGFACQRVTRQATPQEIIVHLKPECVVDGLITERGGSRPVDECYVQLTRAMGKQKEHFGVQVNPADKGRFRIAGLPADHYTLQVAPTKLLRHMKHLYQQDVTLSQGQSYTYSTVGKPCKVTTYDPFGRPNRRGHKP